MRSQQVGWLGEEFVARWLRSHGWTIVAQQWRCRWGELDIIAVPPRLSHREASPDRHSVAQHPARSLLFIEVKTRNANNWDADGALAISALKQAKLWRAVRVFLSRHPEYSEAVCRFDVALVRCDRLPTVDLDLTIHDDHDDENEDKDLVWPPDDHMGRQQAIEIAGYQLAIISYLEGAIEAND
ncbi:MAG: YraN family protein [Coleofasciculaceae cyanobacterium RL_1_1]|nr:YraN family protein [Coleofasciculaceae cyanobacterium RL_1_1]